MPSSGSSEESRPFRSAIVGGRRAMNEGPVLVEHGRPAASRSLPAPRPGLAEPEREPAPGSAEPSKSHEPDAEPVLPAPRLTEPQVHPADRPGDANSARGLGSPDAHIGGLDADGPVDPLHVRANGRVVQRGPRLAGEVVHPSTSPRAEERTRRRKWIFALPVRRSKAGGTQELNASAHRRPSTGL